MERFKPQEYSVLIVDDAPHNIHLVNEILEGEGYDTTFANSGKMALERLQVGSVDLILLDLMMPEMDGIEVCSIIKENPNYKDIPIIFMTAHPDLKSLKSAFKKGAIDYLCKPFNSAELLARIKNNIINKQALSNLRAINTEIASIMSL